MVVPPPESSSTVHMHPHEGRRTPARGRYVTQAEKLPCIPGYDLQRELGRGGMGVVYLARRQGLGRLVALKMIQPGLLTRPDERARFCLEAEMLARVQHPGIVQVHEVGEQEGQPFLALEYVDGPSLSAEFAAFQLMPPGTTTFSRTVLRQRLDRLTTLVEQLARAMHAAHLQGVIHRDLKPANILLSFSGAPEARATEDSASVSGAPLNDATPKIIDFGLAKSLHQETGLTTTGVAIGTPAYMAPEQAQGQRYLGPAVDIHALGILLYELLTGRVPFAGDSSLEMLQSIVEREPTPPSAVVPQVPRDLETICLKCLAKQPAQRYATALDLAEDLRRFRTGEPITARPVGRLERWWRWCRRNPALATLLTTIVVALAGMTLLYGQAASARDQAEKEKHCTTNSLRTAERHRQQAEQAVQDAQEVESRHAAVQEFLCRDLLAAVKPDRLGPHVSIKQALDAALPRLETAFRDQPRTEALLRNRVATLYLQLRDDPQAEHQARRALTLCRQEFPPDHAETLTATRTLATALERQDKAPIPD